MILKALISYLCGSFLFSPVLAKIFKLGSLSKEGSGNPGATNLARVSGKKWLGILGALLDGSKAAIIIPLSSNPDEKLLLGLLVVIGHLYPCWNGFRGGKGIATFLGVSFCLKLDLGLFLGVSWLITFIISRISSLSSLVMALTSLLLYPLLLQPQKLILLFTVVFLIIFKHRQNIRKLLSGKEKKLG